LLSLTNFVVTHFPCRAAQRGGSIRLLSLQSFDRTLALAQDRISHVIASKLDDFFELAEIDWLARTRRPQNQPCSSLFPTLLTPRPYLSFRDLVRKKSSPALRFPDAADYLDEMIGFLMNFVDAVLSALTPQVRTATYKRACQHIAKTMMVRPNPSRPMFVLSDLSGSISS
jgi:hypothetical protein